MSPKMKVESQIAKCFHCHNPIIVEVEVGDRDGRVVTIPSYCPFCRQPAEMFNLVGNVKDYPDLAKRAEVQFEAESQVNPERFKPIPYPAYLREEDNVVDVGGQEDQSGGQTEGNLKIRASLAAFELAEANKIDLSKDVIIGTGADGLITKPDVEKFIKASAKS